VIGKVLRGERPAGLIYYLYGPGRYEEHTDPHIVAGWRDPAEVEPPLRPDGRRDFRRLNGLLSQTVAVLGDRAPARPVWHCVARAAPSDRMLSDAEWAQAAREIMRRTGLAPDGQDDDAVRWVAIRHAADHIHIVATLARQDGGRASVSNDYYRVREACRAIEEQFGLRITAPGDRTAARRPTRAEAEKARRHGWAEPPRVVLKRAVSEAAAGAGSEAEFFARLAEGGVLVRKRFSVRDPGLVTGYAVALAHGVTRDGQPVWYSGGKLATDLTLPKLRARWAGAEGAPSRAVPGADLTADERAAIWDHAGRAAAEAAAQIRDRIAAGDPFGAADAAWAAGDTLHAAAAALRSRVIRQAAAAYDRAGRVPYGRIPRRTGAGSGLRRAARLLSAASYAGQDPVLAQAAFIARLTALAEAVGDLRAAQQHAAQATAARLAAERLHAAAAAGAAGGQRAGRTAARKVARLAGEAFPHTAPVPGARVRPSASRSPAPQPAGRPRRRPGAARPRGPGH
jgi:hypothetical protein